MGPVSDVSTPPTTLCCNGLILISSSSSSSLSLSFYSFYIIKHSQTPIQESSNRITHHPHITKSLPSPDSQIPMLNSIHSNKHHLSIPLLPKTAPRSTDAADHSPTSPHLLPNPTHLPPNAASYRSLAVLSGHLGSVSCLALCGEFLLSASQGKDIIVWQQPDLRRFAKFGQGEGMVKALVSVGSRVFTAHQDSRIRVWKVSRSSENIFRLAATLPTAKDYLGKFMKQSNYVQTRRNHKKLWIQHADSISCLAVTNGLIYSGSWDKTLKVWRISDLKCLESIRAHDDAINGLVAHAGVVYSASADGKIKVWGGQQGKKAHSLKWVLEGHKDVALNAVVVCDGGIVVYGGGSDGYVMGWKREEEEGEDSNQGGLEKWRLTCETKAHGMAVLCLCLMGEFLCSGSADKSIGMWKRDGGGRLFCVRIIKGHEGPVKCLQASWNSVGGGHLLYSGGLDKSLRVWWVPKGGSDCEENEGGAAHYLV